jgi:Ca2+:H+ antiporter
MGIDEMTLSFDGFEVVALFASALYIGFLTGNGKSMW